MHTNQLYREQFKLNVFFSFLKVQCSREHNAHLLLFLYNKQCTNKRKNNAQMEQARMQRVLHLNSMY